MPYESPGGAFTAGLTDFYTRQELLKQQAFENQRAIERERRQAVRDKVEDEQAKSVLDLQRRRFDIEQADKEDAKFKKTVGDMVRGDIPTPELYQQGKKLGYAHLFPGIEVLTEPDVPEPPAGIAALPEPGMAATQAPVEGGEFPAVRPPQLGGYRFRGTKDERELAQRRTEVLKLAETLSPDDPRRAALKVWAQSNMTTVPTEMFKAAGSDVNVGTFEDYVVRQFGQKPTVPQLEAARKKWADLGRDESGSGSGTVSYQNYPELDANSKPTGKFWGYNNKNNTFELVKGPTPISTKAAPGAGPLALEAHKKASAVNTLNQLDRAIDEAAEFLGPGAGRVTNIEQMVGSANPVAHSLATKMLLAKMKIDAAIGGVRAAASPQLLARWDNILGLHTNADSLHAAVNSMREIMDELDEGQDEKPVSTQRTKPVPVPGRITPADLLKDIRAGRGGR